jgi:hypothetical protein
MVIAGLLALGTLAGCSRSDTEVAEKLAQAEAAATRAEEAAKRVEDLSKGKPTPAPEVTEEAEEPDFVPDDDEPLPPPEPGEEEQEPDPRAAPTAPAP